MSYTILRGLGRWGVILATTAALTVASLFVFGSFLITWPILRMSPRDRRLRVTADLVSQIMTTVAVYSAERMRARIENHE